MYAVSLQLITATAEPQQRERSRRRQGALTELSLRDENVLFEHSKGIRRNNDHQGFVPGFRLSATGELAVSRYADGSPAPIHMLDGLPEDWIGGRDTEGHVTSTRPGVVSGFIREGRFFTREEVVRTTAH